MAETAASFATAWPAAVFRALTFASGTAALVVACSDKPLATGLLTTGVQLVALA
jgi:hypothetical protein